MVKLFTRRPPEMHPCLSQLFMHIMKNSSEDVDVLARAGYYYNLLQTNVDNLKVIFDEVSQSLKYKEISDETDPSSLAFNTLEIMYNKPAETFIKSYEYFLNKRNKEKALKMDDDDEGNINSDPNANHAAPVDEEVDREKAKAANAPEEIDILGGDITPTPGQKPSGGAAKDNLNEEDQGRAFVIQP